MDVGAKLAKDDRGEQVELVPSHYEINGCGMDLRDRLMIGQFDLSFLCAYCTVKATDVILRVRRRFDFSFCRRSSHENRTICLLYTSPSPRD